MSRTPLSRKQQNEQAVFAEFVRRMEAQGDWLSIDSRPEPEPDLLCIHAEGRPIAFELVSLTDSTIAKVQKKFSRGSRLNVYPLEGQTCVWSRDRRRIQRKDRGACGVT